MASTARSAFGSVGRFTGTPADSQRAFRLLHAIFVLLPIVVGLDKFADSLANWSGYLAPLVTEVVPVRPELFMRIVGVGEIGVGLLLAVRPRVGAYVLAAWLAAVIFNLMVLGRFWDVALRDFGLMLSALALARLSPSRAS